MRILTRRIKQQRPTTHHHTFLNSNIYFEIIIFCFVLFCYCSISFARWAKSPKIQSEGVRFCKFGTQIIVPYCQKYTPTSAILPTKSLNKKKPILHIICIFVCRTTHSSGPVSYATHVTLVILENLSLHEIQERHVRQP